MSLRKYVVTAPLVWLCHLFDPERAETPFVQDPDYCAAEVRRYAEACGLRGAAGSATSHRASPSGCTGGCGEQRRASYLRCDLCCSMMSALLTCVLYGEDSLNHKAHAQILL